MTLVQTLIREYKADINARDDQSDTPLGVAATSGNLDAALCLICDFGCDPNLRGYNGRSLLHDACEGGNVSLVQTLILEHMADISARDDKHNTPLGIAAACGRMDVALCLINEFCCDPHLKGFNGRPLLHDACEGGNVTLVQTLIRKHEADINAFDDKYCTPLAVAAHCGKLDVALCLINEFGCDTQLKGFNGRSLLHDACQGGNVTLVQTLIQEHKADVNAQDNRHNAPIGIAALCGKLDVVLCLINEFGCDPHMRGFDGRCLLHNACGGGNVMLIQTLIREYKADVSARDDTKKTPVGIAAACGKLDVVLCLINEFGCDPYMKGFKGRSLLHDACEGGNITLVQTLIREHEADISARDDTNTTPLGIAAAFGKLDAALCLINEYGCDPYMRGINGRSLLHDACEGGNVRLVETLIREHKADISARDDTDNTPPSIAAACGKLDVALYLIKEFGCDPHLRGINGRSLLHDACQGGNVTLVQNLIREHKADVNALDDFNNTPLCVAAAFGKLDVALCLINEFGYDPHLKCLHGRSLLHCACEGGNVTLVQTLIREHKADISARDDNNCTPIDIAAWNGKLGVVLCLINEFNCDPNLRGFKGRSLLHHACEGGNIIVVRTLIRECEADINAKDDYSYTPLGIAAVFGKMDVALCLINEFGCDPHMRAYRGRSLLHDACQGGNVTLVQTLIREHNADINALDDFHNSPICVAAAFGRVDVALCLINEFGCNLDWGGCYGRSLLHYACQGGNITLVQTLMREHNADINVRDNSFYTPLHIAATSGRKDVVLCLIDEFGCDPHLRGYKGISLLHCACLGGNIALVKVLIQQYKLEVSTSGDVMGTPLFFAALGGNSDIVMFLIKDLDCDPHVKGLTNRSLLHSACEGGNSNLVRTLIEEFNADFNDVCELSTTPLHIAALCGKQEVVRLLIDKYRCDPNTRGYMGKSLLHLACDIRAGNINLIRTLINDYHADVNSQDDNGNTPLAVAAYSGQGECALVLINEFGADINVRGTSGRSLLHNACEGGRVILVRLLLAFLSMLSIDMYGNTPLHICAVFNRVNCVHALLSANAPVLIRNNNGCTPIDLARGESKLVIDHYLKDNQHQLKVDYNEVIRLAAAKYSGENHITRVLVLGHPGAGKSSLVESLKREGPFRGFGKTVVAPHTAGIVPSSHTGKQIGRVLFFDFAGDPEYYSSHAAILEKLASSEVGENLILILVNMVESTTFAEHSLHYWVSFIQHQNFFEKGIFVIVLGSHLDKLNKKQATNRRALLREFTSTIKSKLAIDKVKYFMLDCRKAGSTEINAFQQQVSSWTSLSPKHRLSGEASLLLGLLEKDFSNVTACSLHTLLIHVQECRVCLPGETKGLCSVLSELHDVGVLLLLGDHTNENSQVVLKFSKLTNEVHELLFSKTAVQSIEKKYGTVHGNQAFNIGILPDSVLAKILPPYITKECLHYLQYCQEIKHEDVDVFPYLDSSYSTTQSFEFFPALCHVDRTTIAWHTSSDDSYSIHWLALCSDPFDFFPPRFLHVLQLRLVFKFTLSASSNRQASPDFSSFQRRCTMWKTGLHWLMTNGVECMVELVRGNKGVVVITKSSSERAEKCTNVFTCILSCVMEAKAQFCHSIRPDFFILDSANESDYFNPDHQFAMSDVEQALSHPEENEVIVSVSGKTHLERAPLSHMCKLTHWNNIFRIDLHSVLQHLDDVVQELEHFCLVLGIPYHVIRTAEKNHPRDFNKAKTDLVYWWMIHSPDPPCWWHLVRALSDVRMSSAADEIKVSHSKCNSH